MDVSLVVPAYNEEENIRPFYDELVRVFGATDCSYEVIFVDDGSSDGTYAELQKAVEGRIAAGADAAEGEPAAGPNLPTVKAISFSRNFGKEAALLAGLKRAEGNLVGFIDADLQQRPETFLQMVRFLDEHPDYDCVAACQENRGKGIVSNFCSRLFYKALAKSSHMDVLENASDFRVFRRCVADALMSMGEYHRFSKGLFSWVGFKTHAMMYTPDERNAGKSTWSFWGLVKYAFSGLISFSTAPLRATMVTGFAVSFAALVYLVVVLVQRIAFGVDVPGYATTVGLILVLGGLQLFFLGVVGEYIARMYIEGKHRPVYIERRYLSSAEGECAEARE